MRHLERVAAPREGSAWSCSKLSPSPGLQREAAPHSPPPAWGPAPWRRGRSGLTSVRKGKRTGLHGGDTGKRGTRPNLGRCPLPGTPAAGTDGQPAGPQGQVQEWGGRPDPHPPRPLPPHTRPPRLAQPAPTGESAAALPSPGRDRLPGGSHDAAEDGRPVTSPRAGTRWESGLQTGPRGLYPPNPGAGTTPCPVRPRPEFTLFLIQNRQQEI